ncbi:glutathione peroxidase [Brachybacterium hainanense]|uniref:Glutathione peroxidase n=1 Tax=Brachybacterium hainanense TaxID=1541174 RepID=A0ABV6RD09_9MICO
MDGSGSSRARTLHSFSATTLDGQEQDLSIYRGELVLVVNTASRCAFTRQFEDLQRLQLAYQDHGFTVLGFPSSQFLQEPLADDEIIEFCRTSYDVTFPLFSKVDVNGPDAHPLWRWLTSQRGGILGGRISWNFTKFLLSGEGTLLRRYAPVVPPLRIARRIEQELGITGGTAQLAPPR